MSQTTVVPPFIQQAMKFLLKTPAHGIVSKTVLLITLTGRKSGKQYTTPVSYTKTGDQVTIFAHAKWWKNLQNGQPVTLRIQGQERRGLPTPVAGDQQAIAAGLANHLRRVPSDARWYGVTFTPTETQT